MRLPLTDTTRAEFLVLTEQDRELRQLFDRVRVAGKMIVKVDSDEFVVEFRRTTITGEARKRLTEGGPAKA
jgi:hypothetical protein